jgi:hypothetical protein
MQIVDKVATISDSKYTPNLVPLILHFHAVLGPEWPIVFFTTPEVMAQIEPPASENATTPAAWKRAVDTGAIAIRHIPSEYDMSNRTDVNKYLTRPWLWEQLAPAKHVLVFQADAMICANAPRSVESFFKWDLIGGWVRPKDFNGGLSLRNREILLDILYESTWEEDIAAGRIRPTTEEDAWTSGRFKNKSASLPDKEEALQFALQYDWQIEASRTPLGYHKVHKKIQKSQNMEKIVAWCPEIALARPGSLESYDRSGH